jgi:hypothetical protein
MAPDKLQIFEEKKVRSHWDEDKQEWFWSVVDVCGALTDRDYAEARKYWNDLKRTLKDEGSELVGKTHQLKMTSPKDGKAYETDVLITADIFRLVQSIPSKKAEPFKVWLGQLGSERLDEIADPEKAINRALMTYKKKGYSDEWIERRIQSKNIRDALMANFAEHGIEKSVEFAVLTDTILKTWSGKTTQEYKTFKDLKKENLRDHMSKMELVLAMLGESATDELVNKHNPQGFDQNNQIARQGGTVALSARKEYEKQLGGSVVTPLNAKNLKQIKDKK